MPPRKSLPPPRAVKDKTLVLDNGGFSVKAGFAHEDTQPTECQVIPNCVARDREKKVWVGHQLESCNDFGEMSFRRPIEKGFVVNWEAERAVWNTSICGPKSQLQCDPSETNLILTEAPNCPQALQANCDQIVFEEFEFAAYCRAIPQVLLPAGLDDKIASECVLVIDSGYSHTTVVPVFQGRAIQSAIKRLTIGGKFLTNSLRELISVRHFNVTEEPWLVNEIKEATCFVSGDFPNDIERFWKGGQRDRRTIDPSLLVDYVLPDFQTRMRGVLKPYDAEAHKKKAAAGAREPILTLGNERFTVPELLFNPSDAGMQEAGLPAVVKQSLDGLPEALQRGLAMNIICVGGNFNIPNLFDRLRAEITQLLPSDWDVNISMPIQPPEKASWTAIARAAADRSTLNKWLVTRAEYQENGSTWLARRFAQGPGAH